MQSIQNLLDVIGDVLKGFIDEIHEKKIITRKQWNKIKEFLYTECNLYALECKNKQEGDE